MNLLKIRLLIARAKEFYKKNPERGMLVLLLFAIVSIYTFSKNSEVKTIVYKKDVKEQLVEPRMISNHTDNIYQRKNRVLTDRIKKIEKNLEKLLQSLNKKINEKNTIKEKMDTPEEGPKIEKRVSIERINAMNLKASNTQPYLNQETQPEKPVIIPENLARKSISQIFFKKKAGKHGSSTINFPVKKIAKNESVRIPLGSYVKAKLLTGVEAAEGKPLPVIAELDHVFIGPNKTMIDLKGCFALLKSAGNLSVERAEGQAVSISCVSDSGQSFERKINGFMVDDTDNSFGVIGVVNSKQDRVATQAFLASIVDGISSSVKQGQETETQNPLGGSSSVVTGDQSKHILASGGGSAAQKVTQWYLKHAENLMPTINVGSGSDIWIVMQEGVNLPNWFFKEKRVNYKSIRLSFLDEITK